jgi:uncharacterized protein YidB (DUF937 family)
MGLFDGVLGGVLGAGAVALVTKFVNQQGGIQGVVDQFQKKGLDGIINSWIGTGENKPVTADQITQTVGAEKINEMAKEAGVDPKDLAEQLAQHLPTAIDKITPDGKLPDVGAAVASVIPQAPKV